MIPRVTFKEKMPGFLDDYQIVVSTTNSHSKNWIFGCKNLGIELNIKYWYKYF